MQTVYYNVRTVLTVTRRISTELSKIKTGLSVLGDKKIREEKEDV